ncbi:hypothetical protein KFU94_19645 [Chloroflexi bacterium TSY]|nr:hypothetical protein [Chloroflexi bacterium TSY]
MITSKYDFIAKPITQGPKHHFFGYYDISPWNQAQTHYLVLETDFHERAVEQNDEATVALVETTAGHIKPISQTRAFNLQQGSMMHWIDVGFGEEITHNDWEDGALVSRAINPETGSQRTIHGAIAAISPTKPIAIGLNFARMRYCRKVVGYANDHYQTETLIPRPTDDGLFLLNLQTGASRLLLSLADLTEILAVPELLNQPHWFNHVLFNTDGSRLLFFCRVAKPEGGHLSSLWTINPDGTELDCQIPFGNRVSHFAWQDPERIIVTTDAIGDMQFVCLLDRQQTITPFGKGLFPPDGHFGFSPDYRWIVCDTYPNNPQRLARLFLYDVAGNTMTTIGEFRHAPHITGDWRCDLHPRWSPDGSMVSFDSVHEGSRQVYVIDLSKIVN